jgi:hypothetical protein
MNLQSNKRLITETLKARRTQAFTAQELSGITLIPLDTLRGILRHMVHAKEIHKTETLVQTWNKRKTEKFNQPQVWYHFEETHHGISQT